MILHFNNTTLDLTVEDDSYRYREIKGAHAVTLYFSLPQHVEIPVGAYCEFEGETYTLEEPENFKMHNSRNFEYTLTLESTQAKLKKYRFRNPLDRQLKFSLTAKPQDHLKMLIDNLNRRDSGWCIGECVTATEQVISYNHTLCDAALSQMADTFETEWEVTGKTISLHKVEYNKTNPLSLSYGKGKGFRPDVGRISLSDKRPIEILFVQGGDRNIDKSKYGSKELLLPKAQRLVYEGRTYVTDTDGLSLQRADKPLQSHAEDSLDCSHIYPSRVGSVTKVETTKEGFCDFLDTTIPETLDYSKYRIEGEKMTVIFQSGMLSGKEFDIQQEDKTISGYVHKERRFKIVEQEVDGEPMPKGNYMPVVGDTYAVFGMMLPDAYLCDNVTQTGASWDLFREGAKYLYEHEEQQFTFTGELDGIWAKKDWLNIGGRIKLGGYILFSDPQFQIEGVGIRIVGIKDYINNPHSPELELSNSVVGSSIMSDLRKIESNEVVVDDLYRDALQFTKRRFRDAKETTAMLEKAMLNFTGSVNPLSVQTMQLILGDESLQYRFVDGRTNPQTVAHEVIYTSKTKVLTAKAGTLQHLTLGVKTLSSSHKAGEYKFWDLPLFNTPPLTEGAKRYYLYAKVSTTTQTGEFRISEQAVGMEEVAGYYHLLVGFLNSEYDGDRSFVPMYGFAELTPGRLTISRIVSADGKTYFDLERGEIGGHIIFTSSSGVDKDLSELDDALDAIPKYELRLSRENASVACTVAGVPIDFSRLTSQATVIKGSAAEVGWTFAAQFTGCTGEISARGEVGVYALAADNASVTVTATKSGLPILTKMLTITKVRQGESAYSLEILSSSGTAVLNHNIDLTLTARVLYGADDVTDTFAPGYYSWRRISINTQADVVWNEQHAGVGKSIRIGNSDVVRSALFECLLTINGTTYYSN
ncbi:MAG: hypothetical protein RR432_05760 [Alistipes sp.]